MSRLSFIFVLILTFTFQLVNGQGRSLESVIDIAEESSHVNRSCIEIKNYCCHYAAMKTNSHPEEHYEEFVSNSRSSAGNIFFGPILIIISLLVLRAFSKRVEE
ncbi:MULTISPECIES: hypothetical protein [unclassified Chryseobacterium]|uniref:hypothetical protein n=1 Tax=unclassified Chryseobacterium TaxID=2593645 RepID=UPI000F4E09A7|nr:MULTISPECIES: hypothetical protein [unclassified Chryseobacterium]